MLVGEIAERHRIPKKFLDQILRDLKHHGLVQSRRGRNGGYALLKPAAAISFGEVVRIIDGPIAPLPCLSRMAYRACEDCEDEENCVPRPVFALVHEETAKILKIRSASCRASGCQYVYISGCGRTLKKKS